MPSGNPPKQEPQGAFRRMAWISLPFAAVLAGMHLQSMLTPAGVVVQAQQIPAQAQVIDQRSFNGASCGIFKNVSTDVGSMLIKEREKKNHWIRVSSLTCLCCCGSLAKCCAALDRRQWNPDLYAAYCRRGATRGKALSRLQ